MPDVRLYARLCGCVSIFLWFATAFLVSGQNFSGNPYDARGGRPLGYSPWELHDMENGMLPSSRPPSGPATISADILRHPLSSKARRLLEKAMHLADLGNHSAAIQSLRETLAKVPSSAPYAHNLLGLEYTEEGEYFQARSAFEEAVRLMPHESANHSNFGYSLAITGDLNSAEREARKALQLNPGNSPAQSLLELLLLHKRKTARP